MTSVVEAPHSAAHACEHARRRRRHPDCTADSAWRTSLWFSGTQSYSGLKCTSVDGCCCCCWTETWLGYPVVACCCYQVVLTFGETPKYHCQTRFPHCPCSLTEFEHRTPTSSRSARPMALMQALRGGCTSRPCWRHGRL